MSEVLSVVEYPEKIEIATEYTLQWELKMGGGGYVCVRKNV